MVERRLIDKIVRLFVVLGLGQTELRGVTCRRPQIRLELSLTVESRRRFGFRVSTVGFSANSNAGVERVDSLSSIIEQNYERSFSHNG